MLVAAIKIVKVVVVVVAIAVCSTTVNDVRDVRTNGRTVIKTLTPTLPLSINSAHNCNSGTLLDSMALNVSFVVVVVILQLLHFDCS